MEWDQDLWQSIEKFDRLLTMIKSKAYLGSGGHRPGHDILDSHSRVFLDHLGPTCFVLRFPGLLLRSSDSLYLSYARILLSLWNTV